MSEQLLQEIKGIFLKYGVVVSENEGDHSIDEIYGIDSISYMQILNELAQNFGFKIQDADLLLGRLTTFNNIVEYVIEKQSA